MYSTLNSGGDHVVGDRLWGDLGLSSNLHVAIFCAELNMCRQ